MLIRRMKMTAGNRKSDEKHNRELRSALCFAAAVIVFILLLFCGCSDSSAGGTSDPFQSGSPSGQQEQSAASPEHENSLSTKNEKTLDNIKIKLVFGKNSEIIDKNVFMEWTTVTEQDGKLVYSFDEKKLRTYAHSLAKKYNTFSDDLSFTDHSGKQRRVQNLSVGWLLNEAYAANMIKGFIQDGTEVTAELTDDSKESRKWWIRHSADYDYESKKGDTFAEVSISEQYMWVVRDGTVILESPIVTGTPGTQYATPPGGYYVYEMLSPCTLSGMDWEVKVSYWLAFNFDIGFHDAYWQKSFGGETYYQNGSHGCVNLPFYAAEALYSIAYLNMPVYVY